jgi:hypothetical protein
MKNEPVLLNMRTETLELIEASNRLVDRRSELRKEMVAAMARSEIPIGLSATVEEIERRKSATKTYMRVGIQLEQLDRELEPLFTKAVLSVVADAGLKSPEDRTHYFRDPALVKKQLEQTG